MGACVSTQNQNQNQNQNPMKLFGSNLLSPTQQKPPIINANASHPPLSFQDFGSKEDTFFDSQAWLESDCDDDFMSVNGEFTPSRGTTPVHHNFSVGNKQQPLVSPYPNTPEKKPRLSDLFKESLRADNYDLEDENEDGETKSNVSNGVKTKRERLGCFRSLVPSRSSSTNGRKMMMMSPNLTSPNPKSVVE
ncbi:uncharacterized protein At3g27210 [Cynara cardunculus var. scolymus]|uniref:Uncharacterized protein n=1 Tax=Cynara cardunculus var. scolymus TaxID=59895 RepID=A0A124SC63_CYNCS|nr:uncharacterized protein At3g27210 [Cynara cardunculus var. scolymus]KVH92816.1 hypothetical protein Ccrd_005089 [Cynara cardunculus var. scolymus]